MTPVASISARLLLVITMEIFNQLVKLFVKIKVFTCHNRCGYIRPLPQKLPLGK